MSQRIGKKTVINPHKNCVVHNHLPVQQIGVPVWLPKKNLLLVFVVASLDPQLG
jgi:hypothetical protein